MISINTNLSSLIAQNSMKQATSGLNQAIERMTTGFKINHSKDNAANYSITTNKSTKINSYMIAEDNVAMGMDLVTSASDMISTMQDHATRLRDLATQARNGTYGASSMNAINAEVGAILSELDRLYSTAEYNKVALFNNKAYDIPNPNNSEATLPDGIAAPVAKEEYGGFIADPKTYEDSYVDNLTSVTSAINGAGLQANKEYKVSSKEDLQALATFVNGGGDTENMTFIMSEDINLESVANWTPIGNSSSYTFKGKFDGNGHKIKNLTINNPTADYQGLFGYAVSSSTIQNVGIEGANVKGKNYVGALVGEAYGTITNNYATGNVSGTGNYVGGLAGNTSTITNSYATGDVTGQGNYVGGLAGNANTITNSYTTGDVSGYYYVGGLVGWASGTITNSYATGDVSGKGDFVGGLVGDTEQTITITNSYATGDVNGNDEVGGLVGEASGTITNSYATGDVSGTGSCVGGLVGWASGTITNSYATGDVNGTGSYVGGLVGYTTSTITNCYATGNVSGNKFVGGLIGDYYRASGSSNITNCTSYSQSVIGNDQSSTGSLIGGAVLTSNGTSFGTINISGCKAISEGMNKIGGCFKSDNTAITYDMTTMLSGISEIVAKGIPTTLQIGVNGDDSCRLSFDTNFELDLGGLSGDITSDETFKNIDEFVKLLSEKATQLGAVQNRLESALDSIEVNLNNLTSSRSTLRDADIAEESSDYIRQQILQQASATLLATANQSPSIALQLI